MQAVSRPRIGRKQGDRMANIDDPSQREHVKRDILLLSKLEPAACVARAVFLLADEVQALRKQLEKKDDGPRFAG